MLNFSNTFPTLNNKSLYVFSHFQSADMVYYTDGFFFFIIKSTMHSWDKYLLLMTYYFSYITEFDLTNFIKDYYYTYVYGGYWSAISFLIVSLVL